MEMENVVGIRKRVPHNKFELSCEWETKFLPRLLLGFMIAISKLKVNEL